MVSMPKFATGDRITITMGDQTVNGKMLLISPNQMSGIVSFEAILDGYVGMMPITMDSDGIYRDLITHKVVIILPAQGDVGDTHDI